MDKYLLTGANSAATKASTVTTSTTAATAATAALAEEETAAKVAAANSTAKAANAAAAAKVAASQVRTLRFAGNKTNMIACRETIDNDSWTLNDDKAWDQFITDLRSCPSRKLQGFDLETQKELYEQEVFDYKLIMKLCRVYIATHDVQYFNKYVEFLTILLGSSLKENDVCNMETLAKFQGLGKPREQSFCYGFVTTYRKLGGLYLFFSNVLNKQIRPDYEFAYTALKTRLPTVKLSTVGLAKDGGLFKLIPSKLPYSRIPNRGIPRVSAFENPKANPKVDLGDLPFKMMVDAIIPRHELDREKNALIKAFHAFDACLSLLSVTQFYNNIDLNCLFDISPWLYMREKLNYSNINQITSAGVIIDFNSDVKADTIMPTRSIRNIMSLAREQAFENLRPPHTNFRDIEMHKTGIIKLLLLPNKFDTKDKTLLMWYPAFKQNESLKPTIMQSGTAAIAVASNTAATVVNLTATPKAITSTAAGGAELSGGNPNPY